MERGRIVVDEDFKTSMEGVYAIGDLIKGMRAHLTYNEGIAEALEEILGGAVHVMPKKKK